MPTRSRTHGRCASPVTRGRLRWIDEGKARCGESRTPGLEGGVGKPAERQGARLLPYAFRSDLLVRKKHTLNGERNFVRSIASAVTSLASFRETEADRIRRFMHQELSAELADALILRAYERGIVGAHQLP